MFRYETHGAIPTIIATVHRRDLRLNSGMLVHDGPGLDLGRLSSAPESKGAAHVSDPLPEELKNLFGMKPAPARAR